MDLKGLMRETYAVIDLDRLEENYRNLKAYVGEDVEIACVIKADAYGHGAREVAGVLIDSGVRYLAVACLSEALVLRKEFDDVNILVMGNIPDNLVNVAIGSNIIFTIYDIEQAKVINQKAEELGVQALVHIKYDTGFNRLGFSATEQGLDQIAETCQMKNLKVEGFFSHLALKDDASDLVQVNKMNKAQETLASWGYAFDYYHICDSIAAVEAPQYHMNMIRPGAILYGLTSHRGEGPEVNQVMSLHSKLSRVKWIKAGEHVSYGDSFIAEKDALIGTIPIGYADGYPRNLTNRSKVMIKGKLYPIVGRTCMDQCMVDLTGSEGLERGDDVIVYSNEAGSGITIAEIAKWGETNKNEIVARLSKRVPKVYMRKGQVARIVDDLMGTEL